MFTCLSDPHNLKIIYIFINNQPIFMFKVLFWLFFVRNMIKLIISCLIVSEQRVFTHVRLPREPGVGAVKPGLANLSSLT